MKIRLTGVTGYIAQRLLPVLLSNGHQVICCVRDINIFNVKKYSSQSLNAIEADFLKEESLKQISDDIDATYYLIPRAGRSEASLSVSPACVTQSGRVSCAHITYG